MTGLRCVLNRYDDLEACITQSIERWKGDKGDTGPRGEDGLTTSVTMNGTTYTQEQGNINLGTVITQHQDISGKEDTTNKITSISSSSTDAQYPSAKCVYELVGDVESALTTLISGGGVQ